MNRISFSISLAVVMFLITLILSTQESMYGVMFGVFILANIVLIWMVYTILKNGKPLDEGFEEKWYNDDVK